MKLFVGNLSWNATEEELKNFFKKCGEVVSVRIVSDPYTGRSKGFGFVEMEDEASGEEAIRQLDNTPFLDRPLRVSKARQEQAGGRQNRGGGGYGGHRGGYGHRDEDDGRRAPRRMQYDE